MKVAISILTCSFLASAGISQTVPGEGLASSDKIQKMVINGEEVTVTSDIPPEVLGRYLYEKKGEPIIQLNGDGTGIFQTHQRPGIPIRYWIRTDAAGVPLKKLGQGNPNYAYTIVLQYGEGGGGNYPAGKVAAWWYTKDLQDGCANILGERYKC